MIKKKWMMSLLCLTLAASLVLSGCSNIRKIADKSADDRSLTYDKKDQETDAHIKGGKGFVSVAQKGNLELFVDGSSAQIAVKNLLSGKIWYSDPQHTDGEEQPTNWSLLQSQVIVHYVDDQQTTFEKNSYDDAVTKGQFTFFSLKNGVRVNYIIGSRPIAYCVPDALSAARYQKILSKLDDIDRDTLNTFYLPVSKSNLNAADKALMIGKYPFLAKTDIYILSTNGIVGKANLSAMLMEMIEPIFAKVGYTPTDLAADDKASGSSVTASQDTSVKLSVEYTLDDSGFIVNIPQKSIGYDTTAITVTDIDLMPYFGTANEVKDGYLFVPDGSGALIGLNSGKANLSTYRKIVYGEDNTLAKTEKEQGDGTLIHLPVYGMKIDNDAFLAVIEAGDANATIVADVKNKVNTYPFIYSEFRLKESNLETTSVLNVSGNVVYQKHPLQSDLRLRYLFINGDAANYTGMAKAYQKYLLANGSLSPVVAEPVGLYINLLGAVQYKTTLAGIPIEDEKPLTTYDQASEILSQLIKNGAKQVALGYTGWQNNGMQNTISTDIHLVNSLGNKKSFNRLLQLTIKTKTSIFPSVDFAYICHTNELNTSQFAAKNLSDMTAYLYDYDLSLLKKKENPLAVIVSPKYFSTMAAQYAAASRKYNLSSMGILSFGNDLNADYNKQSTLDRQQTKVKVTEMLKQLHGAGMKLQVSGANAYTLSGVSLVTDVPLISGQNYLFDQSVPFYSIVLHGVVPTTSQPLNLSADYKTDVLRAAETGTIPAFQWIYAENTALKNTDYNYYSVNYNTWLNRAVELYKQFAPLENCRNATITANSHQGDVAKTVFDNGTEVVVNYGTTPVTMDGREIAAKDFAVIIGTQEGETAHD